MLLETLFLSTPSARRATGSTPNPATVNEFLSTPSARRATTKMLAKFAAGLFLSTPSARRATRANRHGDQRQRISIHALREEGDAEIEASKLRPDEFLSTPSARRATRRDRHRGPQGQHFYPRPPRGGRPPLLG